jgi:hypothetical protein
MSETPDALRAEIHRQQAASEELPLVSLELFFAGNNDLASIGCNLADHPGVDRFRDVLLNIRARADVNDVLVAITDEMTGDEWPFSDTVVIVTSASTDDVRTWVDELVPDDVMDPDQFPLTNLPCQIPPGMRHVAVWWD